MPDKKTIRRKFAVLKSVLDERVTRLWAGAEAEAIGYGGIKLVGQATGLAISTVTKGRNELRAGASAVGLVKVRRSGGGRPKHEKVHAGLATNSRRSSTH